MRERIHGIAMTLLGVIAVAWPLGHYQNLPIAGTTLTGLAAAALVLLWLLDLATSQRPRLPFELLWPAVLAMVIALIAQRDHALTIAGCALTFLATVHFARDRQTVERLVLWSGIIAFVCAIVQIQRVSVIAKLATEGIAATPPPMFNLLGVTHQNLAQSAATIFAAAFIAIAVWNHARKRGSIYAGVAAAAIALTTAIAMSNAIGLMLYLPAQRIAFATPQSATALVAAWLAARIGAKVVIERHRKPDGDFLLAAAPLLAAVVASAFVYAQSLAWHAWAAGIAVGYVIRDNRPNPELHFALSPAYAAWLVLPTLVLNVSWVNPEDVNDPRNFDRKLRQDYEAGDTERFKRRLAFYDDGLQHEPMIGMWHARLALDETRPEMAAAWIARFDRTTFATYTQYPKPTQADTESLLNQLRDQVSAIAPERRGLAYERALIARGETETAEASLRLRIAGTNPVYEEINADPLWQAATFLTDAHQLRNLFDTWSVAELLAVLELLNNRIQPAPEGVDRSWLPLAVAARRDADSLTVEAVTGAGEQVAVIPQPAIRKPADPAWPDNPWQVVELPFESSWQIALHQNPTAERPIATITVTEDGVPSVAVTEPPPDPVPDASAVFVWLP